MSKRYECRDQNGDTLESFDSPSLAATYMRSWYTEDNIGAGIWDNETETEETEQ